MLRCNCTLQGEVQDMPELMHKISTLETKIVTLEKEQKYIYIYIYIYSTRWCWYIGGVYKLWLCVFIQCFTRYMYIYNSSRWCWYIGGVYKLWLYVFI